MPTNNTLLLLNLLEKLEEAEHESTAADHRIAKLKAEIKALRVEMEKEVSHVHAS